MSSMDNLTNSLRRFLALAPGFALIFFPDFDVMVLFNIFSKIKGSRSNSFAVGLLLVSIVRHFLIKLLNSGDQHSGYVKPCGGFKGISNIALIELILEYGGSPSAISMAVMPKDQISVFLVYSDLVRTSGLIQCGVPAVVFFLLNVFRS